MMHKFCVMVEMRMVSNSLALIISKMQQEFSNFMVTPSCCCAECDQWAVGCLQCCECAYSEVNQIH